MKQKQTADERQTLDWIIACSSKAPGGLENISCHSLVRMVRNRLGMTQEQLAKRVGLPQSHIAKIETGNVDIQISTMKRIFKALHCEPVMMPRPVKPMDAIIADRIREVAERNIGKKIAADFEADPSVADGERQKMVAGEIQRLTQDFSSDIWNE